MVCAPSNYPDVVFGGSCNSKSRSGSVHHMGIPWCMAAALAGILRYCVSCGFHCAAGRIYSSRMGDAEIGTAWILVAQHSSRRRYRVHRSIRCGGHCWLSPAEQVPQPGLATVAAKCRESEACIERTAHILLQIGGSD